MWQDRGRRRSGHGAMTPRDAYEPHRQRSLRTPPRRGGSKLCIGPPWSPLTMGLKVIRPPIDKGVGQQMDFSEVWSTTILLNRVKYAG